MAQRIQAPLNADLCLIISREGLSVVPQKKTRGGCDREIEKKESAGKTECARKARSRRREKRENLSGHVVPLLQRLLCI